MRVLEARDRVGGRTLTTRLAGASVDLGGQWVGPGQTRVAALMDELGLDTFAQHHRGVKLLERDGTVQRYSGLLPSVRLAARAELGATLARIELLARSVALDEPEHGWRARARDERSVEHWLECHVHHEATRDIARIAVQMIFAVEPRDLSFLFFLHYLRAGGGLAHMSTIRGGAQQDRLRQGAQSMSLRMADALGSDVLLEHAVERISHDRDSVRVRARVRGSEALELTAKAVVLAVPPALIPRIEIDPPLPHERMEVCRNMPMGSVVKCVVAYTDAFWRNAGSSGEAVSTGYPLRAVFDDTSHDERHPALVGFVVGSAAPGFGARSESQRRMAVVQQLVELFGDEASEPVAYVDKNWCAEEWSGGCYTGVMAPGVLSEHGRISAQPAGRLHFAGTETARHWPGYFDGAIESGERAAREVAALLA